MNMIVAVDNNWAIGYHNELLVSIPRDRKFFREETTGKVVIMGRKTLESLPGGRPLPNRVNIVMTENQDYKVKGAVVVHSTEELFEALKPYPTENVYVIGGESIYRQLLPYCNVVHATRIDMEYQADAHFPNLEENPEWIVTADSEEQTYFDIPYTFVKYERTTG